MFQKREFQKFYGATGLAIIKHRMNIQERNFSGQVSAAI